MINNSTSVGNSDRLWG